MFGLLLRRRLAGVTATARCSCVCAQPLGHAGPCDNADDIEERTRRPVDPRPVVAPAYPDKLPAHEVTPGEGCADVQP